MALFCYYMFYKVGPFPFRTAGQVDCGVAIAHTRPFDNPASRTIELLYAAHACVQNVANVLVMYFYTMLAKASGERIFLAIYIELYNMVYTAMPIIFFGVFDQDTSKRKSAKAPELYAPGIRNLLYTHKGFIRWMSEAVLLAALTTYLPIATIRSTQHISVDELSLTSMFLVVLCANLRLVLEVHSWGFIQHLGLWGTLIIFECSILYFSYYFYSDAWPRAYDWNGFYGLVPNVYGEVSKHARFLRHGFVLL